MVQGKYKFDTLSTREGFNTSLRHFNLVMDVIEDFEDKTNLADIINTLSADQDMVQEQIKPVVNALLVDKYGYSYASHNMLENVSDFTELQSEVKKWNAVDIVIIYYHPELGITTINPKNADHWGAIQTLKRNEFIAVFVGEYTKSENPALYKDVLDKFISLIKGKKVKIPDSFLKGKCKYRPPVQEKPEPVKKKAVKKTTKKTAAAETAPEAEVSAPAAAPAQPAQTAGKMKMTPMYGIPVTNELFHNGNVEAWKKIIASYEHQQEGLKVFVFYDGEKINDLNTLFKWGKVKRGTSIMISVAGENIRNVAKLKRYLMQGASNRFEDFLKGSPNRMLKLF